MPMSAFGRSRWFGDDEEQDGPTPLFPATTGKQSLFPVQSDSSPVLGALKSGWKGLGDWLGGPAEGEAGGADGLLAYKPTSRWGAISDALTGAAKGVMAQRGPYANPLGGGLIGATEGMARTREHDLQLRQLAQEQQYKSAAASLAKVKAATAARVAEHAGEYNLGRTHYSADSKPIVTAPPEEMSEADKARLANEDRRIELEGRRADQTEAYQRAQLAQGAAGQAEAAGYHKTEADLARQRLGLSKEEAAQRQAAAAEAAKLDKSGPERDRTKLVTLSSKLAAGQELTPEERPEYERLYREAAQDKTTFDPALGTTTTVRPDIGDLARPPSMAATPAPAPGATLTPTQFPRPQIEAAAATLGAYKDFDTQAREVQELLKDMTPGERMSSDKAARVEAKLTPMIAAMAERGHTGVVNVGEAETYKQRFGDLTGPGAAVKLMLGVDRAQAALDEGRKIMRSAARSKALTVGSAAEAKTLPFGTPFLTPDGRLAVIRPDGKADILDEGK